MRAIYRRLGIPTSPFVGMEKFAAELTPRAFVLCHSDIHRKNIMLRENNQSLSLLDWELALVGDPLYDIAVHFHKMRYEADQEVCFVQRYCSGTHLALCPDTVLHEVHAYLQLERVKSAVIDAYRAHGGLTTRRLSPAQQVALAGRYGRKLAKAQKVWSMADTVVPLSADAVLDCLQGI